MSPPHVEAFRDLDVSDLPDPHGLETDRLRVLWVLAAAAKVPELSGMTASHVSEVLQDVCRIAISRQRVSALLGAERGTLTRVGRKRPASFRIMKAGEDDLLGSFSQRAVFIDPAKALSSIRKVEDALRELHGEVRVCDTYVSNKTFDFLAAITGARAIRLLTENIQDSAKFLRDLAAFQKEYGIPVEVRQSAPGHLHDRYVLHNDGILILGGSLKDLGKKQSILVALSQDFGQEMARAFDRQWGQARKVP